MSGRFLMLVSDRAEARREEVRQGRRPCPEYLRLEERHGVELLDWGRLGDWADGRTPRVSVAHAAAGLRRARAYDAVFSDSEHVGVPLALAMRTPRMAHPHLMLGHHITNGAKRQVFRWLRPQTRISRVLLHSHRQIELASSELGIPRDRLRFQPYCADTDFWTAAPPSDEPLVVSVGREHRDYATLAEACRDLPVRVFIAAGSLFSPSATHTQPATWPANVESAFADHRTLREWYARAAVVAVPLVPTDFQAGVTTILEAMSMARPVVVSATEGQRDIVEDGVTGVMVPPGDVGAMRAAIERLLADPAERARLGANARAAVEARFSLNGYAAALAGHLRELADPTP
ncbi:MAG TPA: glycosyltransferase family 4 protein [Candidatus Dormibacteraeota bacterium]|nr:glycosyltransferase family 4 protein [Candidatus Dormibacteraeota bacterium]